MGLFKKIKKFTGNIYKTAFDPGNILGKGNYISGAAAGVGEALGAHQNTLASRALAAQDAAQKKLDEEALLKKRAEDEQARNIASANRLREMFSLSGPFTKGGTIFTSPQGALKGNINLGGGIGSLYKILLGA